MARTLSLSLTDKRFAPNARVGTQGLHGAIDAARFSQPIVSLKADGMHTAARDTARKLDRGSLRDLHRSFNDERIALCKVMCGSFRNATRGKLGEYSSKETTKPRKTGL